MLPPAPLPLRTLVVILLLVSSNTDPVLEIAMSPPSANLDSVVIELPSIENVSANVMPTLPARPSAVVPVLLAEILLPSRS